MEPIQVLIKNQTHEPIGYQIEASILRGGAGWYPISPGNEVYVEVPHISKYGWFELRLEARGRIIDTYRPSGNTPRVTVTINEDPRPKDLEIEWTKGF